MKPDDALDIIKYFRELCKQSIGDGEFSEDAYADIRERCDELRESENSEEWANELVLLIEDYDEIVDLSAGYPGDFGHALESTGLEISCKLYIESVRRKPTGLIVGLADRAYRSDSSNCGFGIELFNSVLEHPLANASAKEIADMVVNPW